MRYIWNEFIAAYPLVCVYLDLQELLEAFYIYLRERKMEVTEIRLAELNRKAMQLDQKMKEEKLALIKTYSKGSYHSPK